MNTNQEFNLLSTFRGLFEGKLYKHRDSSLGNLVANQLYEDLVKIGKSQKLVSRVQAHERVVNLSNQAVGRPSRRGDGTLGELVPTAVAITEARKTNPPPRHRAAETSCLSRRPEVIWCPAFYER